MHDLYIETQVNSDRTIELSYKPESREGSAILLQVGLTLPQFKQYLHNIDLVSIDSNSFCLVYAAKPSISTIIKAYSDWLLNKSIKDYYSVRLSNAANSISYKFYYSDDLCQNSIIKKLGLKDKVWYANEYGIGYEPKTQRFDYYMYCKPSFDFFGHFGYVYPNEYAYNETINHYAVSMINGKVTKVKRYFYKGLDYGIDKNIITKGLI